MAIKRFFADQDTTITNAYKPGLSENSRATGSNMGKADALETFSIYGQGAPGQYTDASSGSAELSRILIKFPVSEISASRNSGSLPVSGSVNFYMRMFNARHPFTLPEDFKLVVAPISQSWEEGIGLDMDEYSDETRGGTGANWVNASASYSWATKGGKFHASPINTVSFAEGAEDLETDITTLVEQWLQGGPQHAVGGKENFGVGVYFTSSQESYFSSSTGATTGSILHNTDGAQRSYYTKKFFASGSEFFFKRPHIEARWDSSTKDDRGNFYSSSSLMGVLDNLNTIYLYNYIRGQLKDLPDIGKYDPVYVGLYTSASGGDQFTTASVYNLVGSGSGLQRNLGNENLITGGWIASGTYSASFALKTTASVVYDRWYSGSAGTALGSLTVYHTGAFDPIQTSASIINPTPEYVTKITNLKPSYNRKEEPKLRLFIREKNWNPNLYVKATTQVDTKIIEDAYYKIFREVDNLDVVQYGTGSDNLNYTRLSFDVSGNYFDFDMSMLENGYSYGFRFSYYVNGQYHEQPNIFKFRVE